jgi:hypothetical protein
MFDVKLDQTQLVMSICEKMSRTIPMAQNKISRSSFKVLLL